MAKLGVNIDHVATVRQARGTSEPDPVAAAALAELAGAGPCHSGEKSWSSSAGGNMPKQISCRSAGARSA